VAEQTEVYAPVPNDPHAPKARDSEAVAAWRQRMGTEEAKHIYKDRAATAECVNALARGAVGLEIPTDALIQPYRTVDHRAA